MFDELWAFHPDYPDYLISTYGGVYSLLTAQFLKPRITSGTYYVQLKGVGKFDEKSLHRLVAETFLDNPDNLPMVNHIDSDRFNPAVDNLEWITGRGNVHHSMEHGNYKNMPVMQFLPDGSTRVYLSLSKAGKATGVNRCSISDVCNGKQITAGACVWKFISKKEYLEHENR